MYGNINAIRASMNVGGVTQFDFNLPSGYIQEQYYKIAVSYKVNDCKIFINGTKISTDTSATMPLLGTFDRLNFDLGQGLYDFYGNTKALAVWKEALSDQELADLTYPTPTDPTFALDFDTIATDFTFARGSEATYVDAQGLIQSTASNNAPRLDYSTGAEAFLLEPQTTQLVTYSELFSNAAWNKNSVTLESGYLAPDGTNTAFKVDGNNSFMLSVVVTGLAETSTRSIYARTVSGTGTAQLLTHNSNTDNIFTITEQWQRFEVSTANPFFPAYFYAVDFRGSGTLSEIILWGANATNDQDYATSYISSNGRQVTRNQETCINATPEINSEEGVLYAEIAALSNDLTNRIISITNGASVNGVSLYYSSSSNVIRANYYVGGVAQCNLEYILADETDFSKIAFVWKINRFELWVDSIKRAEDLSGAVNVANTMNDLSFRRLGSNIFFGNTKDVQVYTKALSDAELIKLTT